MYEGFKIDFYEKLLAVCNVNNMLSEKKNKSCSTKAQKNALLNK